MKIFSVIALFLILFTLPLFATTYYVSTTGSDVGAGTIGDPYATIAKGMSILDSIGGTVYLRGGTYTFPNGPSNQCVDVTYSGASALLPITVMSYPGEWAILDCSGKVSYQWPVGIAIYAGTKYLHFKNFELKNAGGAGIEVKGDSHVFERLSVHNCSDSGSAGGIVFAEACDSIQILNCDSYDNVTNGNGESANGIVPYGTNIIIRGCRTWGNSDDGIDLWSATGAIIIDSCWSFANGSGTGGDGIGFKLGGAGSTGRHRITNCITFDNRANGMHQNGATDGFYVYNCTSYRDSNGWYFNYATTDPITAKNNIVYSQKTGNPSYLYAGTVNVTNSWNGFTVTNADFLSLDTTGVRGARQSNGKLPVLTFLKLVSGSSLINAGTDVGIPYIGSDPDIGAFEYIPITTRYLWIRR